MQQPTSGMSQPFSQHHAIGDDLDLAARESRERCVAFGLWRSAVDVLTSHAGFDEFIPDVDLSERR